MEDAASDQGEDAASRLEYARARAETSGWKWSIGRISSLVRS